MSVSTTQFCEMVNGLNRRSLQPSAADLANRLQDRIMDRLGGLNALAGKASRTVARLTAPPAFLISEDTLAIIMACEGALPEGMDPALAGAAIEMLTAAANGANLETSLNAVLADPKARLAQLKVIQSKVTGVMDQLANLNKLSFNISIPPPSAALQAALVKIVTSEVKNLAVGAAVGAVASSGVNVAALVRCARQICAPRAS